MSDQSEAANAWAIKALGGVVAPLNSDSPLRLAKELESDMPARPWIELPGRANRDLAEFAEELGMALSDAPLFRRESEVITVEPNTGEIKVMTPERFITWVSDHVVIFESVESGRGGHRQIYRSRKTMPATMAKGCLQSDRFHGRLRPLVRVNLVRMPVLVEETPVLLPEGYDERSQIFTIKSGVVIDEKMTIEQARGVFDMYLAEFRFTDERSKAVAIAMPLALFGIGLQNVEASRMGFMVRANTQGGGKSLIAQMAITPSFGLPENTAKAKEDELRKILDAAALQGSPYLFFDNLKGHFENALIEGFMTTPVWRARVMGTQRFMRGKVCCVLMITGNNLTVSPDLQRRLLQCDLFVEEFDSQGKEHTRDLNPVELNRVEVRSAFLSAMWSMVRHWYNAGRPKAGAGGKPYRRATFAEWSDIFGGIVQCAGYANPLEHPKDDQAAAAITVHQRRLVELLSAPLSVANPVKEYTFQELIDCCVDNDFFPWKIKGRPRNEEGEEWFEVTSECAAVMGLMFTNEMNRRIFSFSPGATVRFLKTGEGRSKRYSVEMLPVRL
jgi:hypothetical protein